MLVKIFAIRVPDDKTMSRIRIVLRQAKYDFRWHQTMSTPLQRGDDASRQGGNQLFRQTGISPLTADLFRARTTYRTTACRPVAVHSS